MTPLSSRHAITLSILLGVALVPVTLHSYLGLETDECENPSTLAPGSVQPYRQSRLSNRALQFREGVIRSGGAAPTLRYVVVRSYDTRRLYYRPEYAFAGMPPTGHTVEWIDVEGDSVPIHRPHFPDLFTTRLKPVVAYLLIHDGQPLDNPYVAQLLAAPRQILTGRLPMTLFLVHGQVIAEEQEPALTAAKEWLASSWRLYRAACLPP